jgi:hypothetical protein
MKGFSLRRTWSLGYEALAPRRSIHLLILALLGILAPLLMQIMLREASVVEASQFVGSRVPETASARVLTLFGLAFGDVLRSGSYFAAWRIALRGDQPTVAAIAYGIMIGLVAAGLGLLANFIGNGATGGLLDSPGAAYLGLIAFFLPLALLFALFYLVTAVMMAGVVVAIVVLLVVGYGAGGSSGDSPASLFAGASGFLTFLALLLSALTIWLSARLSCVTVLLAEQGGFSVPAAIGESWRRTAASQWEIARLLALLGGGLGILFVGASYLVGGGATFVFMQPGGVLAHSQGLTILIHLAVGLPIAVLTVLVPLGIYRQIEDRNPTADVFE